MYAAGTESRAVTCDVRSLSTIRVQETVRQLVLRYAHGPDNNERGNEDGQEVYRDDQVQSRTNRKPCYSSIPGQAFLFFWVAICSFSKEGHCCLTVCCKALIRSLFAKSSASHAYQSNYRSPRPRIRNSNPIVHATRTHTSFSSRANGVARKPKKIWPPYCDRKNPADSVLVSISTIGCHNL